METHVLHIPHENQEWFSSSPKKTSHLVVKTLISTAVFGALAVSLGTWYLWSEFDQRIVPNTTLENINLGKMTREEAESTLLKQLEVPEYEVVITDNEIVYATDSAWLELTPNVSEAVELTFSSGHQGSVFQQIWERLLGVAGQERHHTISYVYNEQRLETWISTLAQNTFIQGKNPEAVWLGNTYRINSGIYGQDLNVQQLHEDILHTIGKPTNLSLPIEVTHTPLSASGRIHAEQRLETLKSVTVTLEISENESAKKLSPAEFFPWLTLPDGFNQASMSADLAELVSDWTRAPENAVFQLDENDTLTEFEPDISGRTILVSELTADVLQTLSNASSIDPQDEENEHTQPTVTVPVTETPAEVQLKDTNSLGVGELIGRGTSTFFGSIPNRVFNVELTSNRLHPTLVKPGEEFSFNRSVGEVSGTTGYKSAYVIQNGRTVLGDGGGVCQVSTTVFRAALDAGLPITQWKAHSYRVGYYEQNTKPGFDATVYAPSTDLKFKNDTEHAMVVSTLIDVPNRYLVVEIWGTSDGRTSTISDYTAWNQRPAPDSLYQDDPSLPRGTTKQIDWAAPGLNTKFTYTVTDKNGEELHRRDFTSYFRPWQAVYLVGTGG